MSEAPEFIARRQDEVTIAEKKRAALAYLAEAWEEGVAEGIDPEILAHAALFTALADLISTYGEEAVAGLAERLPERVRTGEFTVNRSVQ